MSRHRDQPQISDLNHEDLLCGVIHIDEEDALFKYLLTYRKGRILAKVLLIIGDAAEVIDTMVPLYRLSEDFTVVKAGPERRTYHLVQHHHNPNWDVTVETPGY